MSRITGFWKRSLRQAFYDVARQFNGVPTPLNEITVAGYAEEMQRVAPGSQRFIPLPQPRSKPIPPRIVSGERQSAERVAQQITNPVAREMYRRDLLGQSHKRVDDFVMILEQGRLTHDAGVVITPDNRVLIGASGLCRDSEIPTNPLRLKFLRAAKRVDGCVAVLSCSTPYNYYHWMMDAIPRLALYEAAELRIDRYYAPTQRHFQRQTLALLGIPREAIEPATCNQHVVADRLAASSWQGLLATRSKTDFLHQRLTGWLGESDPPSLRVYISRRRRGKRIIVNEDETFAALKPMGFHRYDLESMSVADQISLFHRAECVVGPHGAGLTNIVFCRSGTKVIEVNTPYRPGTCFYDIAHHRELDYRLYLAEPENVWHFDAASGIGDSDMRVSPDALAATVAEVLRNARTISAGGPRRYAA